MTILKLLKSKSKTANRWIILIHHRRCRYCYMCTQPLSLGISLQHLFWDDFIVFNPSDPDPRSQERTRTHTYVQLLAFCWKTLPFWRVLPYVRSMTNRRARLSSKINLLFNVHVRLTNTGSWQDVMKWELSLLDYKKNPVVPLDCTHAAACCFSQSVY